MDDLLGGSLFGFAVQLMIQLISGLTIPSTLVVVSIIIWSSTRKWIPILLLVSAAMLLLHWVPLLLLHPLRILTVQQYSKLTVQLALAYWIGTIGYLSALLGMGMELKWKSKHPIGN